MAKRRKKKTENDPLSLIEAAVLELPGGRDGLDEARAALNGVAVSARDAQQRDVAGLADTLGELLELLETQLESGDEPESGDLLNLIRGGMNPLRDAMTEADGAADAIDRFLESARADWGDYLSDADDWTSGEQDDAWQESLDNPDDPWGEDTEFSSTMMMNEGLGDILDSLRESMPDLENDGTDLADEFDAANARAATEEPEEKSNKKKSTDKDKPAAEADAKETKPKQEATNQTDKAPKEENATAKKPKKKAKAKKKEEPEEEPKKQAEPVNKNDEACEPTLLVGSGLGDILQVLHGADDLKPPQESNDAAPQSEEAKSEPEAAQAEPVDDKKQDTEVLPSVVEPEIEPEPVSESTDENLDAWSDAEDDPWQDSWEDADSAWVDAEDSWSEPAESESASTDDGIGDILKALVGASLSSPPSDAGRTAEPPPPAVTNENVFAASTPGGVPGDAPPPANIDMDAELLEAFLDDASAGNGRLEHIVLQLESNPSDAAAHQEICRELHTLKGASASVGLSSLAGYLHAVEDYVQGLGDEAVDVSPLLKAVDAVRLQIEALTGGGSSEASNQDESNAPAVTFAAAGSDREESLRVKASRVDRLMDLLAELVTLRNQRESRLARLKNLRAELARCSSRLRAFTGGADDGLTSPAAGRDELVNTSNAVVEIAHDIAEFTRSIDGIAEPMEAENIAISQFTRQFRQELMEMRRLPVAGLFQRLNRSAQDAARVEEKRIQFVLEGEHAGLDRSLQERIYEPLLHIVRNAVSHGIEPEADRKAAGKPEVGTITLSAKGGPTTLVIEISDDGRGLNYDAIRAKAIDKGLIGIGDQLSESRLARLIFHPGFSTRSTTSEISGRGVGMDVVAAAMHRIRAKIDIDSRPGQGTTMRLTIPLRSVIEHAMTIRVDGRLYALPMQFVQAAGPSTSREGRSSQDAGAFPTVRLRRLLGESSVSVPENEQLLLLGSGRLALDGGRNRDGHGGSQFPQIIGLIVDAVVGPEEIVIRNLPSLLKSHPLMGGVSLSGEGEPVLMLDGQRLLDAAVNASDDAEESTNEGDIANCEAGTSAANSIPVLVVDDSMSARRRLIGFLKELGLEASEAVDGLEGLDRFRGQRFPIVFTDIEMPRLDGLGLLGEIKRTRSSHKPRVVVVSSRTEEEYRQRARDLGADGYLVKPVDKAALYNLLENLPLSSNGTTE